MTSATEIATEIATEKRCGEFGMAIGKHLVQRGKQGRFYLRLAVPRALQSQWGKRERIKALGTSDRSLAERMALPILAAWRAEEQVALGQGATMVPARRVPSDAELEEAAVAMHDIIRDEEAHRRQMFRGWDDELVDMQVAFLAERVARQGRQNATGDFVMVADLAEEVIEALQFDIPRDSDRYKKLCELLNVASFTALKVSHQHATGDIEADTDSPLVARVREREAATAKPSESILELFERWAAEALAKGEKREDTVNQDRKVIEQFAGFVGKDRSIRSITPHDVIDYRDRLRELPPKWASNKQLRGLSMRDAAVKARRLGLGVTAFTTVNKHLSPISPLYKWLAKQPAWAGLVNPCNGLFHDKVKGKNPRPPFSTDHLNKILKSPLYTGFMADGKEHLAGNMQANDWRFWIPLIAMFTGARIGEVAQLRCGDIRQERGVWFIHIREDEEEGLKTKNRKSRPAAVHAVLERIGLLKFHAARMQAVANDLSEPVFPELKPNQRGQISGKPARWWRDYLERIGVKDGGDGFGAHSFRHTLADRLRSEVELLDNEIAVLLGHSEKTTTGGYGGLSQGTVTKFKTWTDGVVFEGVDFSHLIDKNATDAMLE